MGITDYFVLENPNVLPIAVGFLLFIIGFTVFDKYLFKRESKGIAIVGALILSFIGGWYLYRNQFIVQEKVLSLILFVVVVVIVIMIIRAFVKFVKKQF